jgi:hypothetical protein
MIKIIVVLMAFATCTVSFAQDDFRDYIVTKQKVFASSDNWGWDPVWDTYNYGNGDARLRDALYDFFKNKMTVQVKEGKGNNGRLLFITHKEPLSAQLFWLFSGYKWRKANQNDPANEVVDSNKADLVNRINEWMEPFGFSVELAKNSDIGRARYRKLIQYYDYGVWVIMKPNQVAACKKAVDSHFTKVVKVVDNRGNLTYHPYRELMKEYNKTHKN